MCDHKSFNADVKVERTEERNENGDLIKTRFCLNVRVKCTECGAQFMFNPHEEMEVVNNKQKLVIAIEPSV